MVVKYKFITIFCIILSLFRPCDSNYFYLKGKLVLTQWLIYITLIVI
jgi:hypothetical protein